MTRCRSHKPDAGQFEIDPKFHVALSTNPVGGTQTCWIVPVTPCCKCTVLWDAPEATPLRTRNNQQAEDFLGAKRLALLLDRTSAHVQLGPGLTFSIGYIAPLACTLRLRRKMPHLRR